MSPPKGNTKINGHFCSPPRQEDLQKKDVTAHFTVAVTDQTEDTLNIQAESLTFRAT